MNAINLENHPKNTDPHAEFLVPKSIEKRIEGIYYDIIINVQDRYNVSIWVDMDNWGIRKNGKELPMKKIDQNDTLKSLSSIMESNIEGNGFIMPIFRWVVLFICDEKWRQEHGYYNCKECEREHGHGHGGHK